MQKRVNKKLSKQDIDFRAKKANLDIKNKQVFPQSVVDKLSRRW